MSNNYARIVKDNLERLYNNLPEDLSANLPGDQDNNRFLFNAFGEKCVIEPGKITLGNEDCPSVFGILISLYALNANPGVCSPLPFKSFKEFPDSMPYAGAFATHTEQVLVPYVDKIKRSAQIITEKLKGEPGPHGTGGDFSFTVYPLPKIALCCIFYEADDDFPASATCLFSNNANRFMPVDGLADVGEYTSKKILKLIR